ncbi:transmembrane protein 222 [Arapaima gigas]
MDMMADVSEVDSLSSLTRGQEKMDPSANRFPFCVVWTPIVPLSWFLPFIGHVGICTSAGVIRDFAGPYVVVQSGSNTASCRLAPRRYWKLDLAKVHSSSADVWDAAVFDASKEYEHRMHHLCWDNCHSHVAMALNLMHYDNSTSWNMAKLCLLTFIHSRHVSWVTLLKTWLPFVLLYVVVITVTLVLNVR